MGNGLNPALQRLIEDRKIMKIRRDPALIAAEIKAAKADLKDARESLELKKHKWATIQGYYALFHGLRALLFEKGFREKSHHALLVAIRELYADKIERSLIQDFEHGMYLRQEADYGLKFSERGALDVIKIAETLLARARAILRVK
ncbi:MAG: HEPN domain-containing protein [Candidatus Aminicenantes bacterium]|nr:HEPN domain-containing protein [Candidatus Aminicenantes bacterium]